MISTLDNYIMVILTVSSPRLKMHLIMQVSTFLTVCNVAKTLNFCHGIVSRICLQSIFFHDLSLVKTLGLENYL